MTPPLVAIRHRHPPPSTTLVELHDFIRAAGQGDDGDGSLMIEPVPMTTRSPKAARERIDG